MLHRWKLNLNTCKKCMLRYWKISAFCLQISHRSIWKELSLFSRHIFLFDGILVALQYTGKMSDPRAPTLKSWNAITKTHTCTHTHSLPRHYDNDVIHVRKHKRTHAQRATRLWVELVLLPEFNGAAMLKSLQIGGVNPP